MSWCVCERERAKLASDWSGNGSTWQLARRQSEWTGVWATAGSDSKTTLRVICTLVVGPGSHLKVLSTAEKIQNLLGPHKLPFMTNYCCIKPRTTEAQSLLSTHWILGMFWKGLGGKTNHKQTTSTWEFFCVETKLSVMRLRFVFKLWEMLNYCIRKDFIRACLAHIFSLWEWSFLK